MGYINRHFRKQLKRKGFYLFKENGNNVVIGRNNQGKAVIIPAAEYKNALSGR